MAWPPFLFFSFSILLAFLAKARSCMQAADSTDHLQSWVTAECCERNSSEQNSRLTEVQHDVKNLVRSSDQTELLHASHVTSALYSYAMTKVVPEVCLPLLRWSRT